MAITVSNQNTSWDADTNADYDVTTGAGNVDAGTQRVVIASDQAEVSVAQTLPTTINSGVKSVTTAGIAETLVASSTPCKKVILLADPSNTTSQIYYGASDVDSTTGMIVYSAQKEVIEIDDAQKIYVDVGTNGDSIRYIILT